MRDLDIGMAMVTARLANSELRREREQETRKKPAVAPRSGRNQVDNPSLRGIQLEVVKGKLVLVPSGEPAGNLRKREWTMTRRDGSVVRIRTGGVMRPPNDD